MNIFSNWSILAFLAAITISIQETFIRYITNYKTCNIFYLLLYLLIFQGIISFIILNYIYFTNNQNIYRIAFNIPYTYIYPVSLIMMLSFYLIIKSIKLSPNPGYAKAIVTLNVIFACLLAYYWLNLKLNIYAFLGIIISLLGIFIVLYNLNK